VRYTYNGCLANGNGITLSLGEQLGQDDEEQQNLEEEERQNVGEKEEQNLGLMCAEL